MNKKLTIFVDMDDTIEDLCTAWVNYLNNKYGTSVKPSEITDWDITKFFPTLTESNIYDALRDPEMWATVKPKSRAQECLYKLKEEGHQVLIVTAAPTDTIVPKLEKVLYSYFPFFTYKDVIITSRKQLLHGDVMIDDCPQNLIGGHYTKLLMDAPHNQSFDTFFDRMIRVYNWKDAYHEIEEISNKHPRFYY